MQLTKAYKSLHQHSLTSIFVIHCLYIVFHSNFHFKMSIKTRGCFDGSTSHFLSNMVENSVWLLHHLKIRHVKFLRKKMRDNARRLVFIQHFAREHRVICAAMHREKFEVQGYVKDNSIKQCKKKVINT